MARGIIYVMTTAVPGLIKIGKTGLDNFEDRMYILEKNGYSNVTALKRRFAIEVDDYDEKEMLLDEIFSKSKVYNTELYALDIDLVVQLLSSFEGKQIYPKEKSKEEIFDAATKEREIKIENGYLPDGEYFFEKRIKGFGQTKGKAIKKDGVFTVLKGSICAPSSSAYATEARENRRNALIKDNVLQEDVVCDTPSGAGWLITGKSVNGWVLWKDKKGQYIDVYRKKVQENEEED